MATEVQIRAQLDTMRSLPPRLERLASCLGTTNWPNQPVRLNFPSGMEMSAEERAFCEETRTKLTAITEGTNLTDRECSKARLSLLTRMLLGFPAAGGTSEAAADAKLEMYNEAVRDIAPWAINEAVKRWARGEGGEVKSPNFSFAPSPADLRRICLDVMQPFKVQIVKINRLLTAMSAERAMDPAPIQIAALERKGRVIEIGMRRA